MSGCGKVEETLPPTFQDINGEPTVSTFKVQLYKESDIERKRRKQAAEISQIVDYKLVFFTFVWFLVSLKFRHESWHELYCSCNTNREQSLLSCDNCNCVINSCIIVIKRVVNGQNFVSLHIDKLFDHAFA